MDRLQSMRAFVKVVDEQSFAGAARAFEAAPAAITRLVADLESHLGVRLLQRSSRRLALTSAGEIYLPRARSILAEIDETEALTSYSSQTARGRLRVLVSPSFARHQLAKHLPHFYAGYPEIALDLASAVAFDTLDEAFDVSLLIARNELYQGDFIAKRLATTHVVLCASPDYLARQGTPTVPAELARHRALVLQTGTPSRSWRLTKVAEGTAWHTDVAAEVSPACALSAEHADTPFGAALVGVGIAALPSYIVEDALTQGTLVRVLDAWSLGAHTVYAAMPTRKYVPAKTRAFLDFLAATFKSPDDPWLPAPGGEGPARGKLAGPRR